MDATFSLCTFKALAGIPQANTAHDTQYNQWLNAAIQRLEKYCGRTFGYKEFVEYPQIDNSPYFMCTMTPVRQIISIYESDFYYWGQDPNPGAVLLRSGTDYALELDTPGEDGGAPYSETGKVFRILGVWRNIVYRQWQNQCPDLSSAPGDNRYMYGSVKVTYMAGYPGGVPDDVQGAAAMLVNRAVNVVGQGAAMAAESYSDYAYTLGQVKGGILTDEIRSMVSTYRNLWMG